ncbi:MAG: 7-carboxy-7-deazaguanine synthase QueE [Chitinophagaceae bacterium]
MSNTAHLQTSYPVMETFYSIQGEGFYQGHAAFFIRLGGCDVGCVWCDVKESWDAAAHPKRTVLDLLNEVKASGTRIVVITGGEPLMHDCTALTETLREAGFQVNIETSASHPISGTWDWICVSPKKFKAPLPDIMQMAHELKVVCYHKSDLAWAEEQAQLCGQQTQLYLQPEWSREKERLTDIIEFIGKNPRWILSLQIHKYMEVR